MPPPPGAVPGTAPPAAPAAAPEIVDGGPPAAEPWPSPGLTPRPPALTSAPRPPRGAPACRLRPARRPRCPVSGRVFRAGESSSPGLDEVALRRSGWAVRPAPVDDPAAARRRRPRSARGIGGSVRFRLPAPLGLSAWDDL